MHFPPLMMTLSDSIAYESMMPEDIVFVANDGAFADTRSQAANGLRKKTNTTTDAPREMDARDALNRCLKKEWSDFQVPEAA